MVRQIRVGSLLPSVANVCGAMHRVRCGALVAVRCRCAAHLRGVCLTCKSRAMLAAMRRRKEYIAPALCGRVPRRAVVRCPFFFFLTGRLCALTGASCHYGRREAMSRAYFATGLFAADAILLRLFERCFAKWQQCHQREHPRVARAGSSSDAFAKLTAMSQMRASMHTFVLENAFSYYTAVPERSLMLFRIH